MKKRSDIYEPCERCGDVMVFGGGLCPDCEAEQAAELRELELRSSLIEACDGVTSALADIESAAIDLRGALVAIRDMAVALRDYIADDPEGPEV